MKKACNRIATECLWEENMKKKLICLTLSVVMLLSVCLTGCGKKDDDEIQGNISSSASADATTLSVYLMSEKEVDAKTEARIENALNAITEVDFKTRLDLHFYTADQYYTKLDEAFAQRVANGAPAMIIDESENQNLIQYPTLPDYQVDIFYVGGLENFTRYLSKNYLAKLDDSVKNASKELNEMMSSLYFNSLTTLNKGIYAVPCNRAIGEYTYLLLNKEALSDLNEVSSGFTSLTSERCQEFLSDVKISAEASGKYVPLWTSTNEVEALLTNLQTWGVDADGTFTEAFSLIGSYYTSTDELLTASAQSNMISNLFENNTFKADLKTLKSYETNGYYDNDAVASGKPFAVGLVQGGAELAEIYGDEYEMVVLEQPRMSTEDLYGHMFAVSNYSTDIERSMKILTHLFTDSEFSNLLLYGVEGEDYQLIDTGVAKNEFGDTYKVVKRTGDSYVMAAEKTGNVFITYPLQTEEMDSSEDVIYSIHEYGIQQNKDAEKRGMTLNFVLNYDSASSSYVNKEWMLSVQTLSESIMANYRALTDLDQFDAFWTQAQADIAACAEVSKLIPRTNIGDHNLTLCGGKCGALTCYHLNWMRSMNVILSLS